MVTIKPSGDAKYSLVMDKDKKVIGFWFQDSVIPRIQKDAQRPEPTKHALLRAAATKHHLSIDKYAQISSGDYRIVPNKFDSKGGSFIMLGGAPAPGEAVTAIRDEKKEKRKRWKFWNKKRARQVSEERQPHRTTTTESSSRQIKTSITITCPNCGKSVMWVSNMVGQKVPCYLCGETFTMPDSK